MKPYSYKRFLAYFLDFVLIYIIVGLLSLIIPVSNTYSETYDEYMETFDEYYASILDDKEDTVDYSKKINTLRYNLSTETINLTVLSIAITVVYYAVFAYYNGGQTLGKKIMKIKIISANGNELTLNNYLIRGLFVNGILLDVIYLIFILVLKEEQYLKTIDAESYIYSIIIFVIGTMILYRKDGRGFHDFLANTKVIDLKERKIKETEVNGEINEGI